MGNFIRVCSAEDIELGRSRAVEVGPRTVAVFRTASGLFAVDDMCTHSGGPLSEGEVCGTSVTCPWHGAAFDLATGARGDAIASRDLRCYAVRERDGSIEVEEPSV
jgi:3-phenylpropionate/trans-cinnamate dioxygenase ferredoxin subunit